MADDSGEKKRGLGDLMDGLTQLLQLVDKIQERGEEGLNRSGEFKTDSGVHGRYGVQIKSASPGGDSDSVEQFEVRPEPSKRKPNKTTPTGPQETTPFVDVFEEADKLTIVAEIPGASAESISVSVEEKQLGLYASTKDRVYRKTVPLPFDVVAEPTARSYRNGIFSAVFQRA